MLGWEGRDLGCRAGFGKPERAFTADELALCYVIGKPSATFFRTAVQRLGIAPEEVAMVGDDLESDVGGAMAAGLHGILVQTGKYRAELLETSKVKPDATLRSIADLPHLLEMP